MAGKFTCKALYGLGVTSLTDFVRLMNKYQAVKDAGIDYINASSFSLPKNKNLLVFDSVKEIFRFHGQIKPSMVIVVSDTPVILKEIPDLIPLDYSNDRSFEFNFIEVDPHVVLRALKNRKLSVTSKFVSFDNLGYHVTRVKTGEGKLLNAYLSVSASMPYDIRSLLKAAMIKFFKDDRPKLDTITNAITKIGTKYIFNADIKNFVDLITSEYKIYHAAVKSADAGSIAAKKFKIDPYAVSYFRKLLRHQTINDDRIAKNNVKFKPQVTRKSKLLA